MNFNFGEVLTRAWQIIWKHKVLWIFGIFAGCGRGGGGGTGGTGGGGGGTGPGTQPFPEFERTFNQIGQWISENPWIVAVFILLIIVLTLLAIFLGTIGRIALIRGTHQAESGAERLNFGELFSESMPYFWRVFGLSLLIFLLALLVFVPVALGGVLFSALTMGIGALCILPLICILIPLIWALSVVIEQANVAIVLDNLGIGDGFRKGWDVVRANLGPIILLTLIIFIGSGVVGFIVALPIIAAVLPLIFAAASNNTNSVWITVLCCAAYLPVLLLLSGMLNAYVQSVWTLTYMRLTATLPPDTPPAVLEANA
jgi:membrane-anchored glycerophosphoryl diester phosphodiesterase (GDPDase)